MAKKKKTEEKKGLKSVDEMMALVSRINKDDPKPEDLETLSNEMERKPEIFLSIGNIQKTVFSEVLSKIVTTNFAGECTKKYVEEMKKEMGYASSTFVEKMLIDEIVMRWLRLQSMELSYQNNVINKPHSLETGVYQEKMLEQASKRFLRSIETLAKVRKMIAQTQAKGAEMFKSLMQSGD